MPEEPRVEIVDSQTRYGRLLGGATDQYILRVYAKFLNETPEVVVVQSLAIALSGRPLSPLLFPGPSLPALLTSKGQEHLHTNKLYAAPLKIPAASTQERYAFFQLPPTFQQRSHPLHCTATVTFSKYGVREVQFVVNW
jgi:hypothetical protein